jgi:hypothetical protein
MPNLLDPIPGGKRWDGSKIPVNFSLALSEPAFAPVTITYAMEGTARPDRDYVVPSGKTTIRAGETETTVRVRLKFGKMLSDKTLIFSPKLLTVMGISKELNVSPSTVNIIARPIIYPEKPIIRFNADTASIIEIVLGAGEIAPADVTLKYKVEGDFPAYPEGTAIIRKGEQYAIVGLPAKRDTDNSSRSVTVRLTKGECPTRPVVIEQPVSSPFFADV